MTSGSFEVSPRLFKVGEKSLLAGFSSSNPSVAEVDAQGSITVRAAGKARITVEIDGARVEFPVECRELPFGYNATREAIVEALGVPNKRDGEIWSWKSHPGLRLDTSSVLLGLEMESWRH